jgi:hypothetical protein
MQITERKTKALEERGMKKVGTILQGENGELAYVEAAAVRWLDSNQREVFMFSEFKNQPIKHPPETAPKDIPFLGKFKSYPWLTMCAFNKPENEYVRCDIQIGLYQGELNDTSFENEYEEPKDLEYWYPMPEHNE